MEIPSFLVHFCRGPLEIPHVLNRGGGGADKKYNGPMPSDLGGGGENNSCY